MSLSHKTDDYPDFETESTLLGAILKAPAILADVNLDQADFEMENNRIIYAAIRSTKPPVDILTVGETLRQQTGQDWLPILGDMVRTVYSTANYKAHENIIAGRARARRARDIGAGLVRDSEKPGAIDSAIRALMAASSGHADGTASVADIIPAVLDYLDQVCNSEGIPGIDTGFHDLNKNTGGFHPTDLIVIGARPAMGKTALMLNMASACGVPCGIVSAEQANLQVGQRLIAINGPVQAHKMRLGTLTDDDWNKVTRATQAITKKQIFINDQPGISLNELIRSARRMKYQHNIKILFVDYLQKVRVKGAGSIRESVAETAGELKNLARELEIPVVALAQLSRSLEARTDKRPMLSDLKESGDIEQEADQIFFLYRDHVYHSTANPRAAEIIVSKNRHGPTGYIPVIWQQEYMRFENSQRRTQQ